MKFEKQELGEVYLRDSANEYLRARRRLSKLKEQAEPIFGPHFWLNAGGLGAVAILVLVLAGIRLGRRVRGRDRKRPGRDI